MSELSFEQLLEESLKTIRTGEVVTGTVIDVKDDEIILNIGYKSDGLISKMVRDRFFCLTRDWPLTVETSVWRRPSTTRKSWRRRWFRFWTGA